jgi:DNA-binding transcriptional LysR family regulator
MSNQSEPWLDGMVAFVAIVQARGFTAAASVLGQQKSTLSRRLAALEAHLGVTLLQRTTRRSRLTTVGAAFYERAVQVVEGARQAEAAARAAAGTIAGTLRVCLPQLLGDLVADSVIIAFLKTHPAMRLDIEFAVRPADPLRDGYDLVVRPGDVTSSGLRSRRLRGGGTMLVAAPAYLARAGKPKLPRDLAQHEAVIGTVGAENEWPLYDADRPVRVAPRTRLRVPSSRIALKAVLAGLGIGAFPSFFVAPQVRTGRLVPVLEAWTTRAPAMRALFPAGRLASPGTTAFLALLASTMEAAAASGVRSRSGRAADAGP